MVHLCALPSSGWPIGRIDPSALGTAFNRRMDEVNSAGTVLNRRVIRVFRRLTSIDSADGATRFPVDIGKCLNKTLRVTGRQTLAMYGVKYLGSIKALTTALMVFATAFGTALFGYLIDIGFTVGDIAVVSGTYIFISLILLFLVRKKLNPVII